MGGGTTTTNTQTSGLNNPALNSAVTTIGNKLNEQLGVGVKPYTESMVPSLSGQTQAGVGALTSNPNNSVFSSGVSGTLGQQAQIAQGNFGNDPLRQRIMDDVTAQTNAAFNASGRFGGGSNQETLTENLVGALTPYDMQRQQTAIGNMGALYGMSNMPASAQLQAGQIMDQYNTAKAEDAARIFDATQNAGWNTVQRGASVLAGTAPAAGTTTTNTQPAAPWWQGILGLGMQAF
jgi:hypothetical protein